VREQAKVEVEVEVETGGARFLAALGMTGR